MRVVLATGNAHKAAELRPLLPGARVDTAPAGFDPEETGTTLLQNALIKARALRPEADPGAVVVADDTGLAVHALDGRPGVYSARYAGPGATFDDNCRLLLQEMRGVRDRRAAFVCVLVALHADGDMALGCGVLPGRITEEPRGERGFGYDPVFVPEGDERSLAELTTEEKNALSHRGRAARRLAAVLGLDGEPEG
ncbi:MAG TPA: RdgB/HAM1 family non-canonical purine NTP pyrophosphatase [Miltoncostaeaceae bacterium]|nr:RdgB/HAM1 family non-canonical purine NTP pyrophosphatase [Miltoncostaeaceae bacterium]